MNTLIILAYIWLPGALVFWAWVSIPGYLSVWSPDWSPTDQQRWQDRRASEEHPGASTPCIILKDVVETPNWTLYFLILLAWTANIVRHRNDKAQLKSSFFNTIVAVMLALRCLGSFSGMLHAEDFQESISMLIPFNANCGLKGMFLHIIFSLESWGRTWLGNFDEMPEQSIWSPRPRQPLEKDRKELNIPWRDVMLRLAYYHLIDGFLHVAWLRLGWSYDEGRPYTQYMNNEEVIVMAFWALMGGWTYLRYGWRREASLEKDLEQGSVDEDEVAVCPSAGSSEQAVIGASGQHAPSEIPVV